MGFHPDDGEQVVGDWTINCLPSSGGRHTGKLTVTDRGCMSPPRSTRRW